MNNSYTREALMPLWINHKISTQEHTKKQQTNKLLREKGAETRAHQELVSVRSSLIGNSPFPSILHSAPLCSSHTMMEVVV